MQTDLFVKKSMKDRVTDYCRQKGFITSVDLEDFKEELKYLPGYLRIHRTARELAQEGILRRLDTQEKIFRGFDKQYAVYEWVGNENFS